MRAVTWSASALWSSVNWIAHTAAEKGLLGGARLDARVISVGNLQAGGSGKTPIVAQLAREACERGLSVCILTRGYRGAWEKHGGVIEPSEPSFAEPASVAVDPAACGDEPALLQLLIPGAWIAVGADRVRQFEKTESRFGRKFDLVILDDGFQHWKIKKDLEILAVTSDTMADRFFRDRPSQAARADLIIWTKGLSRPLDVDKPLVKTRYKLPQPPSENAHVWLVCGVGDPASVAQSMSQAGWRVDRQIRLKDHADYQAAEVARWMREASADGCRVAITGKDWVKWRALGVAQSDVIVMEPEIVFESGRELWERVIWG